MLPAKKSEEPTRLRKLRPRAKLPPEAVLAGLPAADRKLLRRRISEPVECVFDPSFAHWPDGSETHAAGAAETERDGSENGVAAANDDSGLDLLATLGARSSPSECEQELFRRLNYCRYRVMQIIDAHAGKRLTAAGVTQLLGWERAAAKIREELVRANVPLVLAMAKRARVIGVDFSDLVSEGNLALMRSVEKFDCARGYKFSTYACRAILKSFSRVAARAARYRGRFPTEFDPTLEKSDFVERKRVGVADDCVAELRAILCENVANLSEVEAQVIRARFALEETPPNGHPVQGKTLEQVGAMIGVTKERVRQIQNKALGKLRHILDEGILAV